MNLVRRSRLPLRFAFHTACFGVLATAIWSAPPSSPYKPANEKGKIEFNRDIRPIISKCFTCHGHDPETVSAGLRLDVSEGATKVLEDGKRAIVPFHPEQSELVRRIYAGENDGLMPPTFSNKTLTAEEKDLLKQWIAEGAVYKEHWAFVKPVRPALPDVHDKSWPKNEIDFFVLANLEAEGMHPNSEADKRTLIRRVTLDLIGIPPTPKEVDDFLADSSPNAYEKVVDRLLASPHYGERMATDWMDFARYADSNGYQADYERYQWRWRDWVIDAFNKNMPYDQFTIEQLAGDLLPHPTRDQIIATGFNRNHRINTEGGVIPEEWRVETVIDRVETTSTVWLGLTAGCARCHDHKYDPISQKDFYSLYAFFNNVPESGTGVEQPVNHPPLIKAPLPDQDREMKAIQQTLYATRLEMADRLKSNSNAAVNWVLEPDKPMPSLNEGLIARYVLTQDRPSPEGKGSHPRMKGAGTWELGRSTGAFNTNGKAYLDLGYTGEFQTDKPFSYSLWLNPKNGNGSPLSRMDAAHDYRGWDLFLQNGKPALHLVHLWPSSALKVASKDMIPNGQWSQVTVTYDGSMKPGGVAIYINGKKVETDTENDNLKGKADTDVTCKIGTRTGADMFDGQVDDVALYSRVLSPSEAAALASVPAAKRLLSIPEAKRSQEQMRQLDHLWSIEHDSVYKALYQRESEFESRRQKLDDQITTVMVMQEMAKPRDCYVLIRGQYDKHGDKVTAHVPNAFPPLPKGAPNNRLGLAEWIVSPDNPLTARVTVNRLWERFFGTGIVETTEDFGTRAEFPRNPELLDWLGTEFHRLKWDMKAMIKEILMSATYRQSSDVTEQVAKMDPANRLLSHGPRFRLPAEVIRDQALAVSGLLVEKIGGPSVRPYQPDGIWDELNVYGNLRNYKHDTDSGLHRRSLYTIWKRTAAPPLMTLFDTSTRETCRVRRARTDTPLQALALLNDVTYLEAARALAMRMLKEGGATPESRLDFAYNLVLSRSPREDEKIILLNSLGKRLSHYHADEADAQKLISIGDLKNDPVLDPADIAAYTITASTLLNLDETLNKE